MKRMVGIVAGFLALAGAMEAHAWGPAAHAYLAVRVTGVQEPSVVYGGMAPDLCQGARSQAIENRLAHLTHNEYDRLSPSLFAVGFATHNNDWGTDHYVHLHHNPNAEIIYSTRKMHAFCAEFGITEHEAEGAFDMVMEYLVRLKCGPELGQWMVECVQGEDYVDDLVAAFAEPLAAANEGMSEDEAAEVIRRATWVFRFAAGFYGRILMQDEEVLQPMMVLATRAALGCDRETAARYFERAVEMVEDEYEGVIETVCSEVRTALLANPRYASVLEEASSGQE